MTLINHLWIMNMDIYVYLYLPITILYLWNSIQVFVFFIYSHLIIFIQEWMQKEPWLELMEMVLYSTEIFINQWCLRIFQGLQPNKMPARKHHVNKPPLRNYHWCFQAFAIAESNCQLCSCISGGSVYNNDLNFFPFLSISWLWHRREKA